MNINKKELTLDEIFSLYRSGDEETADVIHRYTDMLSTGIVNIINIFRPHLILIGGMISDYAEDLLEDLRYAAENESFGGTHGMIPEIRTAELGSAAGMIGAANL